MLKLRRDHHKAMDRAVVDAYGWWHISPTCNYIVGCEDDGTENADGKRGKKKNLWCFRWPDEARDDS